ncbi:MAG: F0F1 ATP synthase subunit B [Anaerolineales bacterium]
MEALGINAGFLIGQIINFGVFAIVVYLFAWKPLLQLLDNRSEEIAKQLEDARVAAEAREKAEEEAEKIRQEARQEAQQIIAEARQSAEERARPIVEAAQNEAEQVRQDAQKAADDMRENALSGVRDQVVSLSIAAANKIIGESLDKNKQQKIVNDFFTTSQTEIGKLSGDLVVTTALPLNDSEKQKLAGDLNGNVVQWRVDPNILGGVVVRSGDRVVDGSVRSSLGSLAASLN